MDEKDWLSCKNSEAMLSFLWKQEPYASLNKKWIDAKTPEDWEKNKPILLPLYKYYLASCRKIWDLLPQEESRKGIELAERYVRNEVKYSELIDYNYYVEAAAFTFESDKYKQEINSWVNSVNTHSSNLLKKIRDNKNLQESPNIADELKELIERVGTKNISEEILNECKRSKIEHYLIENRTDTTTLLKSAAYFADRAMMFPFYRSISYLPYFQKVFLFPDNLREFVKYPG